MATTKKEVPVKTPALTFAELVGQYYMVLSEIYKLPPELVARLTEQYQEHLAVRLEGKVTPAENVVPFPVVDEAGKGEQ